MCVSGCVFRIYYSLFFFPVSSPMVMIRGQHLKHSFCLYISQTTNTSWLKNGLPFDTITEGFCAFEAKKKANLHHISTALAYLPAFPHTHSLTHQPHLPLPAPALSCLFIPLSRRPIIRYNKSLRH